jgi:hypothetical protein
MTLGDTRPIGVRSLGYGNAVCEVVTIACDHLCGALGKGAAYLARRKLAMSPTSIDVESLMSADLTDPKHWQERAAAVRKTSEQQMTNAESKRTMLWVAAGYDKLVARGTRGCGGGWSPRLAEGLITTPTTLPARGDS